MNRPLNGIALGCVLAALVALVVAAPAAAADKEQAPKPAPAFALPDQDGKPVALKDFAGKIVVLEWANWECPFYQRHLEAGTIRKLAQKYADAGVVFLAIDSTSHHTAQAIKKFHDKHKLPYPLLGDQAGTVGRLFDAKTTPHMIVLDKGHKVAYDGAIDDDPRGTKLKEGTAKNLVAQALDELLAGKEVSTPKTRSYGCSVKYAPLPPAAKKAPDFTLKDQNGKDVALADFAGKVVVLEWINPDCPVWARHFKAKTMIDLAKKYADKGVVWLAVNSTNYWTRAKNKELAEKNAVPYPILDDHEGNVGHAYGAKTTPDMRVINAKGLVVYSGAIDDDPDGKKLKDGTAKSYVDAVLADLTAGKDVTPTETRPYGCSVKYAEPK